MARPARVSRLPASRTCSRTDTAMHHGDATRFEALSLYRVALLLPWSGQPTAAMRQDLFHRRFTGGCVDSTQSAPARWHCAQLGAHSKSSSSTTGRSRSRRHSSAQARTLMHTHTPGPWVTRMLTRHPAALAARVSKRCAAPARAQHSWDGSVRTAAAQLAP